MLHKLVLITMLIVYPLTISPSENILVLTNNIDIKNQAHELVKNRGTQLNNNIEVLFVSDNFIEKDYSGSEELLDMILVKKPLFACYLLQEDAQVTAHGFSNRALPNINFVIPLMKALDIEKNIMAKVPLYLATIENNPPIVDIYNRRDVELLLLTGNLDIEEIINTIIDTPISLESTFYLPITFFNSVVYLTERTIILIFWIFVAIFLTVIALYSKRVKFHIKNNSSYLLSIPLKFLLIYALFFISTLVIKYVISISNPELMYNYPRSLLIIKYLILFFMHGVFFQILKNNSFSSSPYFYSYVSFFTSLLVFILLSIIYLPLGFLQIWPIIITLLFILTKNRLIQGWLLILSPLLPLLFIFGYLDSNNKDIIELFLTSNYWGNILLTIFSIPYLFLQESYYRFIHRKQKKHLYVVDIVISLFILTSTITYIAILIELQK